MIHIPSTQSLRVFRIAAETLNFTKTAEQMCLTQSAVSHQIKQLEEHLRASLFVRHRRGIQLSGTGYQFLQVITRILNELENAVGSVRKEVDCRHIVLRVEPTLLLSGLLPMLFEMLDLIPNLRVQVEASDGTLMDLSEDQCIIIYLGQEIKDVAVYCSCIAVEECFLVCAPELLSRQSVQSLADLKHHRLLLVRDARNGSQLDWETWLRPDELGLLSSAPRVVLGSKALALEAALVGQGIALLGSIPASPHLISGRLVRPLARCIKCSDAYYFACTKKLLALPGVGMFRDWIVTRAASTTQDSKLGTATRTAGRRQALARNLRGSRSSPQKGVIKAAP